MPLNARYEGDAREGKHASLCAELNFCPLGCRCWCHGITTHLNGAIRPDAEVDGRDGGGRVTDA